MPKVILISGGSDGLGKTLAKLLTPKESVVILAHNKEKLEAAAKEIGCDFVEAELTDYNSLVSAVKKVIEKYKSIDVLVNNAGIWTKGLLTETPPEKINEVFNVNTIGTIYLTKIVLEYLLNQKSGQIINIISRDGLGSKTDRSVYSSSKWAITGFTKCLQEDLDKTNIRVTGIYPGPIKTSLFAKSGVTRDLSDALDPEELAKIIETVINLSQSTRISGIEITNNKTKNMDDPNVPTIDLNIDPDMITPQGEFPRQIQKTTIPPTTIPGVIDITPGTTTPQPTTPISNITNTDSSIETKVENSTPPSSPSTTANTTSATVNTTPTAIGTIPVNQVQSPIIQDQTQVQSSPTQTETTPQSPLAEDPDLVRLIK